MPGIRPPSGTVIQLVNKGSVTSVPFVWPGGPGIFTAEATFSGGTVKLQYLSDNLTWLDVGPDTTLLANGGAGFLLPQNAQIRCSITTATVVYAYVRVM